MKRFADGVFAPGAREPLPCRAEDIIAALEPLTLPARVARIERAVAQRTGDVVAVVEGLNDPHNAAAILRTCDAVGIGEVHAIEDRPEGVVITQRVTKGCEKWMDLRRHTSPVACAEALRARGFALYVADVRAARPLADVAALPRIALAFGNEHLGVSDALRGAADGAFVIPMRGMVESFNVSVAAAIALFDATRGRTGDLHGDDALELKARFLMESVREPMLVVQRFLRDRTARGDA